MFNIVALLNNTKQSYPKIIQIKRIRNVSICYTNYSILIGV